MSTCFGYGLHANGCRGAAWPPGDCVQLVFNDTGAGTDAETLECIFEPFFTIKGEGKGAGLGLATVCGIVTGNEGGIQISSDIRRHRASRCPRPGGDFMPRPFTVQSLAEKLQMVLDAGNGTGHHAPLEN